MRFRVIVGLATVALLALCVTGALASSNLPPASKTGAPTISAVPAEGLCTDCHTGNPVNSGGTISITGLPPAGYVPGVRYTITVNLASTQTTAFTNRKWGFQLTAVNALDGTGVGTFSDVIGQGTGSVTGSGSFSSRTYEGQMATGTRTGMASPVTWQIQWNAPDPGIGPVKFFYSGNAANGDGGTGGDFIYDGSTTLAQFSTAVTPTNWGAVKALFVL